MEQQCVAVAAAASGKRRRRRRRSAQRAARSEHSKMRVRGSVSKLCEYCYVVRRRGKVRDNDCCCFGEVGHRCSVFALLCCGVGATPC